MKKADRREGGKSGQVAVEFLTTYGLAFLVLLLALGVISYMGIFNFSDLQSDECSFPSGLVCLDFILSRADIGAGLCGVNSFAAGEQPVVRAVIYNSYGVNITFVNITMVLDKVPDTTAACCLESIGVASGNLSTGENKTVWCAVSEDYYVDSERYKGYLELNFTQQDGSYVHSIKGNLNLKGQ